VVDALVFHDFFDVNQLAEHDHAAAAAGEPLVLKALRIRSRGTIEPHGQRHIFLLCVLMKQAGLISSGRHLHSASDGVVTDPVQRGLLLVDDQAIFRLIIFDVPIDVHNAVSLLEQVAHAPGQLVESLRKTVDLCRRYRPEELPAPLGRQARDQLLEAYRNRLAARNT
jgi:hypothetical protein